MADEDPEADRQSFLGANLQDHLDRTRIAVLGLSGGGSHVVQQLAHIGFRNLMLYDPQLIEESNLHRVVGARASDVSGQRPKVEIVKSVVLGIRPQAIVEAYQDAWQNCPEPLRKCDIIFGCVDTFGARREIEVFSRRYRIPYIDIGMDVTVIAGSPPRMAGQIILSEPEGPCMFCMGYLNDSVLTREAARYGNVGGRPQVVWANGVLASTAIGLALDYLLAWTGPEEQARFLSFDGNTGNVQADPRWTYRKACQCTHYAMADLGDPRPLQL
jgi:hypothetical protein